MPEQLWLRASLTPKQVPRKSLNSFPFKQREQVDDSARSLCLRMFGY